MDRSAIFDGHQMRRPDLVFEPAGNSLADRIAAGNRGRRPATVGVMVWLAGLAILAAVMIASGLILTYLFAPEGLGGVDASVSEWFAARQTPTLNTVTLIGSGLGSTGVIIGVTVLAGIVLASGRHWRQVAFLAATLLLELSVFLMATTLIGRPRPTRFALDAAPPTSSFPSGGTAAAIALYGALAIIIWSLVRSRIIRIVAWILATALSAIVGVSSLYRGMHHMTDVVASVALGVCAIIVGLVVVRAGVATREYRTGGLGERLDAPPIEVRL